MFNVILKGHIEPISKSNDKGVMTTQVKVGDLLDLYRIDYEVNRDINYARLKTIANYIESRNSYIGIFFPSFVLSFTEDPNSYYNFERKELTIPAGVKLKVIDGQHRIKALEQLLKTPNLDSQNRSEILESYITSQIYFGLKEEDERNLFVDINSNAKRVSMSLVSKYDTREIMSVLVRQLHNACKSLQSVQIEFNKSRVPRPSSTYFTSGNRLKNFINCLLFGKLKTSKTHEELIKQHYDEIFSFLNKFFTVFFGVLPSEPGNVLKYVLGHETIQNAIALYLHESIILECDKEIVWISDWEREVEALAHIDWNVKSRMWQPYMMFSRPNSSNSYKIFIDNRPQTLLEVLKEELLHSESSVF